MSFDPYWAQVDLLAVMNGSNGSTTFADSSPYNNTLTANGNAQISTAQSKFGGSSGLFDGTGDYVQIANDAIGDFYTYGGGTIECWIYPTSLAANSMIFQTYTNTGSINGFGWYVSSAGGIGVWAREYHVINSSSNEGTIAINSWYHVALSIIQATGSAKIHVDGVTKGTGTFSSARGTQSSDRTYIGGDIYGSSAIGHISHVRRTRGIARYSSDFTPPSEAFPTIGPPILNPAVFMPVRQAFNPSIFNG
jgi:hypothetical protein